MRRLGLSLFLSGAILAALGVVAFLAQRPPVIPPPPSYAVAKVSDISSTPLAVSVVTERGLDRVRQREGTRLWPCTTGNMGCPGTTELRATLVFLVRDDGGQLHAFIGEDPRNGCALEWLPDKPEKQQPAVFHDICHGSLYDRRGHIVGGPSPFDLNELATEIRESDVYVDPGRILIGQCPGCPPYGSTRDPMRTAVPVPR